MTMLSQKIAQPVLISGLGSTAVSSRQVCSLQPQAVAPLLQALQQDQVYFSGAQKLDADSASNVLVQVQVVQDWLIQKLEDAQPLTKADKPMLEKIQSLMGHRGLYIQDLADPSRREWLNGQLHLKSLNQNLKANLRALQETLTVMAYASTFQPVQKQMLGYKLTAYNPELMAMLKERYSAREFEQVFETCQQKGTFALNIDSETGLVKTAGIDAEEDEIMNQGWVTDSIRNGDLQRDIDPEGWKKALATLANFYVKEKPYFEEVFNHPESYHTGGRNVGVAHIFDPVTGESYDWLSRKRLESHGLALRALCQNITAGLATQNPPASAYQQADEIPDSVINSIAYLTQYFMVLDYPKAPSSGPWEELAFNGFTWDTEVIRSALSAVLDLVHNPSYDQNKQIQSVRDRLAKTAYSKTLENAAALSAEILKGYQLVHSRVYLNQIGEVEESVESNEKTAGKPSVKPTVKPTVVEHPDRPYDASSAFITTSDIVFGWTTIEDVKAHMGILKQLEKTVLRDNGLIRYPEFDVILSNGKTVKTHDGYLTPNWGLLATAKGKISTFKHAFQQKFGFPFNHIEPSNADQFHARASYSGQPDKIATWFAINEMASGYNLQLQKLLTIFEARKKSGSLKISAEERGVLEELLAKSTEFINRCYGRITGDNQLKANGRPAPAWKVPEAFQHVSTLKEDGSTTMLIGVNTPLAWATASLYKASRLFQSNLALMEHLGFNGI